MMTKPERFLAFGKRHLLNECGRFWPGIWTSGTKGPKRGRRSASFCCPWDPAEGSNQAAGPCPPTSSVCDPFGTKERDATPLSSRLTQTGVFGRPSQKRVPSAGKLPEKCPVLHCTVPAPPSSYSVHLRVPKVTKRKWKGIFTAAENSSLKFFSASSTFILWLCVKTQA